VLYILTLHLGDKWIDIQKRQIERFVKEPYKVFARLGDHPKDGEGWKYELDDKKERISGSKYTDTTITYDKHKDKFDGAIPGAQHWVHSMGKLIDYLMMNQELKPTDKILLLDSDAFPIAPISDFLEERLKEYPFVSAQEPMHEWDRDPLYLIPHPMFMMFEAKHILEDNLTDYLREFVQDKNNNWWGGVIQWLSERKYKYYALTRSNKVNLHPLYFAIYDNLIYHHWAGSRNMITRPDRLRVGQTADETTTPDQQKRLEEIALENSKISNAVFEKIEDEKEIDKMMEYFKGGYGVPKEEVPKEKEKKKMKNLESSVTKQGKYVTQIIHFKGGYRKTIRNVDTDTIEQGQFTKFFTKEGRMILIHDPNVLMLEVFQEEENED
tara:strand:+ start:715 stop:1860 length:1146 start_codon:yes stop_codon:yes gene_type:complete